MLLGIDAQAQVREYFVKQHIEFYMTSFRPNESFFKLELEGP